MQYQKRRNDNLNNYDPICSMTNNACETHANFRDVKMWEICTLGLRNYGRETSVRGRRVSRYEGRADLF